MPVSRTIVTRVAKAAVAAAPVVVPLLQEARKPAEDAVRRVVAERTGRRAAERHARAVRAGTVLEAVDRRGSRHWVVYSGDEPVAAYPAPQVDLDDVVRHADLDRRTPPREPRRSPSLPPLPGRGGLRRRRG